MTSSTRSPSAPLGRPHDIVLFGATGFTGKLVAEYLAAHAPEGLRWALAGRNHDKLAKVREEIARASPGAASLPILVADGQDEASVGALAKSARVVCTTVGPYMKYGRTLVAACAENGTHYCDLTGEVPFIRDAIDRHHDRARETGAKIVPTCGFDSIPSDLGVLMMVERARSLGKKLARVRFFAGESRGGVSGGTIASMISLMDAAREDKGIRRLLADPYALDPAPREHRGPSGDHREPVPRAIQHAADGPDQLGVRWEADLGMWTGPFVMAAVNTRVVRRSNALTGGSYGPSFAYSEAMSFGKGPKGLARATAMSAGLVGFIGSMQAAPLRSALQRFVLPSPGDGPSKEQRDNGFFVVRLLADTDGEDGAKVRLTGRVEGKADPGYGETAKMLSEAAMCLALDGDRIAPGGGVLTPATAMGMRLVERLRAAGMVFDADAA